MLKLTTACLSVTSGMVAPHKARVHLFVSGSGGLPPNETTFAEVAQQHGYSTALIGKFAKRTLREMWWGYALKVYWFALSESLIGARRSLVISDLMIACANL
jgi:hypothetical protein